MRVPLAVIILTARLAVALITNCGHAGQIRIMGFGPKNVLVS